MGTPFSNLVIQMSLWTLLLVADWCSGLHAESILTPGLPIENMSVSHKENVRFTDPQPSGQSCDFETSCPWVSSTRNDGTPHWVPTVIGTLTLPEQDQLLESKSSKKGIQGGILLLNTSHISQDCLASSLLSPMFPGSLGPCSLELSIYAQDDSAAERLTVLIQNMNVNISLMLLPSREVNARSGWKLLYSNIGAIDGPFQISLNYTSCGLDNNKILALDSLSLSNCFDGNVSSCPWESSFICENGICINRKKLCDFQFDCPLGDDEGLVCDNILPFGSHCSFEDGTCGWAFNGSGESSWIHTSLAEIDHEVSEQIVTLQGTKGYFLHLHIEGQQREGRAGMYSESLPGLQTNKVCQFSFNFFIYGILNGTLAVYVLEENGGENPLKLWERNGTQSDYWSSATLEVPSFQNRFRLQLLASWGWNSVAHIAIDNITFAVDCFHTGRIEMRHRIHGQPLEMDQTEDNSLSSLSVPQHTEIEWWFNSCGASGPRGPTQAQCDNAYRNTNTSVEVGKYGPLRGIQMWKVPFTDVYKISAYGAAGGTGAKNHNKRCHGIFISAVFHLQRDEVLYILVGQQGEDACPGKNKATQEICLGESSVIEDEDRDNKTIPGWAGGGGAGGGATYIFKKINGVYFPLLVAAGGGGKAYLENPDGSLKLEQFQNSTSVPGLNGKSGAAGGGGGWSDITELPWAGRSLMEGGEGGQSCYQAMATLQWDTSGGFGGGGGACTSGGGGGGYQGGYVSQSDDITADGQDGVSFFHPSGEIFIHPLAVEENHGELHIELNLNCSHCNSGNCKRDESRKKAVCVCQPGTVLAKDNITCIVEENHGELHIELDLNCSHCNSGNCKRDESRKKAVCVCQPGTVLAKDNITCIASKGLVAERQLSLPLILAVLVATVILGLIFACGSLSFVYHRKKKQLEGARVRLQSTEYKLSKIRSSIIMTDYNPNYCFAGKGASLSELKEVPRKNITLLRALGHGAFGEVYEGLVVGLSGDPNPSQVAIKTLPEICSEQDEMDFLMEALIISKFSHQNIVRCIGVSLQTLPRFILLELMSGGDMKTFLRQNRPWVNQPSSLTMLDLLNMARDIACGCKYLEENQFIHRDIAARNCLLTYSGTGRVAKIGDFGMARDIYRASYYRKGGRAMLPVKWMPPEAFLEGIFTSKTDSWSFGVLLWEIFSLGYMPYPCKTNQEVLEFVTSGGRMDPPKNCPGPVYRIMTQCWQHMPDYRPNFSTILERIIYCTQDPDVINTELPVESGPAPEDEGSTVMRPGSCNGLTPLMSNPPLPSLIDTQTTEYKLGELPQEIMVENLVGWNIKSPNLQCIRESTEGSWLQSNPTSLTETKPQEAHKLKNKTKNLWNPTYGSWVMESTC